MIIRKLSDNTKVYIDRYFAIVDEIAENLNAVEGNNISELFIRQMLALHEGGLKMSENILNYTTNSNIENLAKTFVDGSNKSIEKLNDMLENYVDCDNDERDLMLCKRRYNSIFNNMMNGMNGINVTNNLDIDFLSGMIPHHEGEIAVAKNVLGYDICDDVKDFAELLITTHEVELNQMKHLLRMLSNV